MADLALDPNADQTGLPPDMLVTPEVTPEVTPQATALDTGEPPEQQVAQAPAQEPAQGPAPTYGDYQVRLPPAPNKLSPGLVPFDEEEERRQAHAVNQTRLQKVGEGSGEFNEITEQQRFDETSHADYARLVRLLELEKTYDPRQRKQYSPGIRRLHERVINETKAKNTEAHRAYREKARHDLSQADMRREDVAKASNTLGLVSGKIGDVYTKYNEMTRSNDPKQSEMGDYYMKVTPLGTMNAGTKDKPDYSSLNEVTRRVATLNGLPPEIAANYVLQMGRPMGFDDQTKKHEQGVNGRYGRVGTAYDIMHRDPVGHIVVRMGDGTRIRIDTASFMQLEQARLKGYTASQRWHSERVDKRNAPPDWIDRSVDYLRKQIQ